MEVFSERLKSLITEQKILKKDLAEAVGITDRALRFYLSDTQEPTISKAVALADFFGVSLDYLCGRSDDPQRLP